MAEEEKRDEALESEAQPDPWAAAFQAVEAAPGQDAGELEQPADAAADEAGQADGDAPDGGAEAGAGAGPDEGVPVGVRPGGEDDGEAGGAVSYDEYAKQVQELAQQQAAKQVANFFISKNVLHDPKGRLGAYPEHPSIMKKDEDGLPIFINPDTGKPFQGSNPRADARAWCDEYNRTLEKSFGDAVAGQVKKIVESQEPAMRTVRFAPTYNSLDPVRKAMLDDIIEDYEVADESGNVIGYSCDLEKALGQVNKIIASIKGMNAKQAPPTEPELDMKSSKGSSDGKPPEFKSLAEALEWEQNKQLEKAKGKR